MKISFGFEKVNFFAPSIIGTCALLYVTECVLSLKKILIICYDVLEFICVDCKTSLVITFIPFKMDLVFFKMIKA